MKGAGERCSETERHEIVAFSKHVIVEKSETSRSSLLADFAPDSWTSLGTFNTEHGVTFATQNAMPSGGFFSFSCPEFVQPLPRRSSLEELDLPPDYRNAVSDRQDDNFEVFARSDKLIEPIP